MPGSSFFRQWYSFAQEAILRCRAAVSGSKSWPPPRNFIPPANAVPIVARDRHHVLRRLRAGRLHTCNDLNRYTDLATGRFIDKLSLHTRVAVTIVVTAIVILVIAWT